MSTMTTKNDHRPGMVALGAVLVFAAALVLAASELYRELQEVNEHLERIEAQAEGRRVEAMSDLEAEVDEQ